MKPDARRTLAGDPPDAHWVKPDAEQGVDFVTSGSSVVASVLSPCQWPIARGDRHQLTAIDRIAEDRDFRAERRRHAVPTRAQLMPDRLGTSYFLNPSAVAIVTPVRRRRREGMAREPGSAGEV